MPSLIRRSRSLGRSRPVRDPLPPPLVRFGEDPARWVWNKFQLLVAAVALAYIGQLVFVAIYYLLFEVDPNINAAWHTAVHDRTLRHSLRDHGEGLFGGLFGVAAVWNHYRKRRPVKWYDALEMKLSIANVKDTAPLTAREFFLLIVFVPLYAIPGYLGGEVLVFLIHHVSFIWSRVHTFWHSSFDDKLVGYGAAFFFGRRPAKAVFDDLQLWIAERMVALPGPTLDYWWLLPTLRARCNEVRARKGTAAEERPDTKWTIGIGLIALAVVALAVMGAYVLYVIA